MQSAGPPLSFFTHSGRVGPAPGGLRRAYRPGRRRSFIDLILFNLTVHRGPDRQVQGFLREYDPVVPLRESASQTGTRKFESLRAAERLQAGRIVTDRFPGEIGIGIGSEECL